MTLLEIAVEYRKSVKLIDDRIRQLRKKIKSSDDPLDIRRLENRIHNLESMRRDTRDIAVICEHYHDRSYHCNELYKL